MRCIRIKGRGVPHRRVLGTVAALLGVAGCSLDKLLNTDKFPPEIANPAVTKTSEGALAAYRGGVMLFRTAFGGEVEAMSSSAQSSSVVAAGGFLADELVGGEAADLRFFPDGGTTEPYASLQRMRGQAGQAIGLLTDYAPDSLQALVGHTYALEAYAEVFLAELYCSGIPLSTLDYNDHFTLQPGAPTTEVLTHAVALFDTALALVGDSVRFQHLAAVGKGRALLGLGQFAAAAAAVAAVPDGYRYDVHYTNQSIGGSIPATNFGHALNKPAALSSVADREGGNGLDYITNGDPRIAVTFRPATTINNLVYPAYYTANKLEAGASAITLASGVEARLIAAEVALQATPNDGGWLAQLNALRTDGTQNGGGTYNPGTGGVAGLAPLADPGSDTARVSLLFRERAFWLFLTGHRQGDLRRLIRQYDRLQHHLYPVGTHQGTIQLYGNAVVIPIPRAEQNFNPRFTGCISFGA